jgi:polyisoprenoid-binding protein YceI
MKHFHSLILCLLLSVVSSAQETWQIDNAHSNIRFEVGWEDFSVRTGEFKIFEGELTTDSWEDLSNASFSMIVDPKSIDVIADRLSEQLMGERFLETDSFPNITYYSSKVEAISDSTYISSGKISVHGVEMEQDVFIRVKGFKTGRRSHLLGLEISLKLNRNDFGLEWGSPRLGDMVYIVGHLLYQMRIEEEG